MNQVMTRLINAPDGARRMERLNGRAQQLAPRVLEVLRNRLGHEQALTAEMIATVVARPEREVRAAIRVLINRGHVIAATNDPPYGFFTIRTREEAEIYLRVLKSRAIEIFARYRDFASAAKREFGIAYEQLPLEWEG